MKSLGQIIDSVKKSLGGIPYTFHRKEGFYPMILQSDEEARANGDCNPGTLKVVNELTSQIVWAAAPAAGQGQEGEGR